MSRTPDTARLAQSVAVLIGMLFGILPVSVGLAVSPTDKPVTPAPVIAAPALQGSGTVRSSDYAGKVVLVDFWASWCGPCRQSLPAFVDMREKFGAEQFEVIAVNVDKKPQDGLDFLEKFPVTYPVVQDPEGDLARKFGVSAMPMSFIVDGQWRIRHVHEGFNNKDVPALTSKIEELIGEQVR